MDKKFAYYFKDENYEIGFSNKYFDFSDFFKGKQYAILKQVHSDIVLNVEEPFSGREGDGLITDKENIYLIIKTADCYPLIFYNKEADFIGAVHSGWRGTYKNIIKSFKKKALEYAPETMVKKYTKIIVGPGICGNCYEIKEDVLLFFKEAGFKDNIFKIKDKKIFLDVRKAIHHRLLAEGFKSENIDDINLCTFEDNSLFSYRKNKTDKRLYNFIKKKDNMKFQNKI